jgi:hypothetical protein
MEWNTVLSSQKKGDNGMEWNALFSLLALVGAIAHLFLLPCLSFRSRLWNGWGNPTGRSLSPLPTLPAFSRFPFFFYARFLTLPCCRGKRLWMPFISLKIGTGKAATGVGAGLAF